MIGLVWAVIGLVWIVIGLVWTVIGLVWTVIALVMLSDICAIRKAKMMTAKSVDS